MHVFFHRLTSYIASFVVGQSQLSVWARDLAADTMIDNWWIGVDWIEVECCRVK